jgi:hypothetical protein
VSVTSSLRSPRLFKSVFAPYRSKSKSLHLKLTQQDSQNLSKNSAPTDPKTNTNISIAQPITPHTMDSEPAGTTRWVVIPMGRPRDRYELPLWMFTVIRDVIQDANWFRVGLDAVREEILERLSENRNYDSEPWRDFISLQFVTDFGSSLNHPNDTRRPWSYPRGNNESDESSDSSEETSSDDAQPSPSTRRQDPQKGAPATKKQQQSPGQEKDGSASDVSMTSFHSAQEHIDSNEPGCGKENNGEGTADSDDDRHFKYLRTKCQFLGLQVDHLKLVSKSRKRQKAKNAKKAKKKAPKKPGITAQGEEARSDSQRHGPERILTPQRASARRFRLAV